MPDRLRIKTSPDRFDVVLKRLREEIARRGIAEFAIVDHAAGARAAGFDLAEETLVMFGNPTSGTPVMLADPRAGLDLPLRVLIRQTTDGGSELVYRSSMSLADAFDVEAAAATVERLAEVLESITDYAITSNG